MRVVTFKVEEELLELLDRYAIKYGLNRSEAIRKAIEKMVRDELSKETIPVARVEKIKLWGECGMLRAFWKEKFRECNDFVCLSAVINQCYDYCLQRSSYDPSQIDECMSMCNELFEENARDL